MKAWIGVERKLRRQLHIVVDVLLILEVAAGTTTYLPKLKIKRVKGGMLHYISSLVLDLIVDDAMSQEVSQVSGLKG